ncbi:flavodoxin [Romboutsia lituseburensis]|uniref:Flavodoxin n=1 Tax=Romboutsia lituseburensis DSM 797 TaxID=1121325 RepID=A0A1G9M513_9FIRM|nr:flavodoxin [Romboutsia lituseburensis]CEH34619.1 Flavodoxin [Romboutsia lituseburensis]SDL69233.1 flavodoxin, short chain [Romboutsia lituseburensis DSM 797]
MKIIYWSGTGNTEAMANLIAKGVLNSGKEAEVLSVDKVNIDDVKNENILILGCPSMGAEMLEESEFEPFIQGLEHFGQGKKALLFGSYGWGDGEWMRNWEEQMKLYGFEIPIEPVIVNEMPEGDDKQLCIRYGEQIAKL